MELHDVTLDDLPLFEKIHCDPVMMAELGGPLPKGGMPAKLREVVASIAAGECWYLKIVPDPERGDAAGTVAIWEHEWRGERINEIGWMVLPAFQGRGLGRAAVHGALERAWSRGRWDVVHAFPAVSNAPSNAMCRKLGFTHLETCDFEFAGRTLHCNHWRLDVRDLGTV